MNQGTAQNCLNMLDRVAITGHQERLVMNDIVEALVELRVAKTKQISHDGHKEQDGKADA